MVSIIATVVTMVMTIMVVKGLVAVVECLLPFVQPPCYELKPKLVNFIKGLD